MLFLVLALNLFPFLFLSINRVSELVEAGQRIHELESQLTDNHTALQVQTNQSVCHHHSYSFTQLKYFFRLISLYYKSLRQASINLCDTILYYHYHLSVL